MRVLDDGGHAEAARDDATVTERPMGAAARPRARGAHVGAPGDDAEVVGEYQPGGPGNREHGTIVSTSAARPGMRATVGAARPPGWLVRLNSTT